MAQLNPYLHFEGTCREAMSFYQSCFGGDLTLMPVGESPMGSHMPADMQDRMLHAMLAADGLVLMASDMVGQTGVVRGNDVHLCLICQSQSEIETYFAKLAEGGEVGHPLSQEFFGTIGDLTDRFGVRWMLQYTPPPQA